MFVKLFARLAFVLALLGGAGSVSAQDRPVIRNVEDCAQFASRADRQACAQTFIDANQAYADEDDEDDMSAGGGADMMDDEDEDEDEDES